MDRLLRLVFLACAMFPGVALAEVPGATSGAPADPPPWLLLAAASGSVALIAAAVAWFVSRRVAGRPRLVVLTGPQAGNVLPLTRGQNRIGSLPDNEVHLPSAGVSRRHAEIRVEKSRIQVRDLRSKNGTRVNGAAREVSPLLAGDRLEFGDVQAVFELGRSKERKTSAV